jgi:hypothetical protein
VAIESRGGGTGTYSALSGDFPSAALVSFQDQSTGEQCDCRVRLKIYCKNVQSIKTEERLQELFAELELLEAWDVVLLHETWRDAGDEQFEVEAGHVFMGSGTAGVCNNSRGVANVVHRRWSKNVISCTAHSERLCWADIKMGNCSFRLVSTYMPHAWYPDADVEWVYRELSTCKRAAALKHLCFIVGGDFNAVVGQLSDFVDDFGIGPHGLGKRNQRGEDLAAWVAEEMLVVTNICFPKPDSDLWTHAHNNVFRQIDFFCVDGKAFAMASDCCRNLCRRRPQSRYSHFGLAARAHRK